MFIKGLVSIVTPAYNCDKYISQTIDSVINQTYPKWEMVIINDNSTDNTLSVIKKYAEIDQRIKIVSLNMNLGAANARNLGLSNALGQYIAFL
ncbi:MAG: glycosyltransferase family 2 protein, partial [Clostridiaceae bacterium]|nr:glycosyltransferase family 2 protein [Clostridiaceae bacterium]